MKKLIALCLLILTCVTGLAGTAVAERDWSVLMTPPTEEQLSQLGNYRSPYITFLPGCDPEGFTAFAMDLRIAFDPEGTYICPACWNLDVSVMQKKYTRVWSDEGGLIGGYFGFQVLEDGQKVAIMSLWDAFCEDEAGNVTVIKPRVLFPGEEWTQEHTPETNVEGSFVQCIIPFEWETDKDYRFLLEQQTSDQGTELFTLYLEELDGEEQMMELFCFDSGLTGVWMYDGAGFVENFVAEKAAALRALEFWNVRVRARSTGAWEAVKTVQFGINNSLGIEDYEGSWNMGADDNSCWIITSGVPGLSQGPETLTGFEIPVTKSATPE